MYVIISKAGHTPLSAYAVADTPAESVVTVQTWSAVDSAQAVAAGAGGRNGLVVAAVAAARRVRDARSCVCVIIRTERTPRYCGTYRCRLIPLYERGSSLPGV